MDWDKLRIFHAVAEAGGLTQAGEVLHLSQSAVSRQIRALEEAIGAPLFHRHARGLILTGEGEVLFRAAQAMRAELTHAAARIRDERESVKGELRVTTTVGFGTLWLAPRLKRWYAAHPNTSLELLLTEQVLDLAMREADMAIRLRVATHADLIERPLMQATVRLYCSAAFAETHPKALTEAGLKDAPLIAYNGQGQPANMNWFADLRRRNRPFLSVNSHYGVLKAVREGLGVGPLPDYLTKGEPSLVTVAPELHSPPYAIHIAYPIELRASRRVAAFRDFLTREAAQR